MKSKTATSAGVANPSTRRKVLISEELFELLGADRVDWGEPDEEGFYTPTVYKVLVMPAWGLNEQEEIT